jgi:hypothetical protein
MDQLFAWQSQLATTGLVKMPTPMPKAPHPAHSLPPDVGGEHRTEAIPPKPHCLMTEIDSALEQQVFNIAQAQRKPNVEQNYEPNYFGR